MEKVCIDCGREIGLLTSYEYIKADGKTKIVCMDCFKKRENKEIKELKQTSTGRKQLAKKSMFYFLSGFACLIACVFVVLFFFYSFLFLVLFLYGVYGIYRYVSFKMRVTKTRKK